MKSVRENVSKIVSHQGIRTAIKTRLNVPDFEEIDDMFYYGVFNQMTYDLIWLIRDEMIGTIYDKRGKESE